MSVVVITRNERRTIEDCIKSAIRSLERALVGGLIEGGEVILVDSASTDGTVEAAKTLPITILQLRPDWPLSAAAGRQIGYEHARGDLIFFIDGDTVVNDAWLVDALPQIEMSRVAAVGGSSEEVSRGESIIAHEVRATESGQTSTAIVVETEVVNVGLYRRSALDAVGGFQPFLRGAEDLDLGMRMAVAGYRLLRTRNLLGRHHWSPGEAGMNYVDYVRSVVWWSFGSGQACRHRFRDRRIRMLYLRRYASARFAIDYLRGASASSMFLVQPMIVAILPWSALPLLAADTLLLGAALRGNPSSRVRLGLFHIFHPLIYSIVRHAGFALGFVTRLKPANSYPRNPIFVATGKAWVANRVQSPREGSGLPATSWI